MIKKSSITSVQLALMAVGSALIFPYTFMPILNTPPANQDAWIVLLMMFPYVLIINAPIMILINRFRGININETVEIILGKFFGKIAAFIFCLFFLYCLTACSLITVKFLVLYVFQSTPTWALLLFLLVPVCYSALKGAGTIARLAFFFVPLMILIAAFFFILGINDMDFSNLKPVLADSTFLELNQGAFLTGSRYSEILIFFVFSFYLHKKANVNKTYASALIVFGITFMIILLPTILVLGVEFAKRAWNPYWQFSRQVDAYDFIQKVQSINLLVWFPGAIIKLAIYNYMCSFTLSGIFKTKTHKGFVIPLAAISFIACLLPMLNRSDVIELLRSDKVFPYIVLPVTLVLPVILLIFYFIRRKKIDAFVKQKLLLADTEADKNPQPSP